MPEQETGSPGMMEAAQAHIGNYEPDKTQAFVGESIGGMQTGTDGINLAEN